MRRWRFRSKVFAALVAATLIVVFALYAAFRFEFEQALVRGERPRLARRARRVAAQWFRGEELPPGAPAGGTDFVVLDTHGGRRAGAVDVTVPRELVARAIAQPGQATTETIHGEDGAPFRALVELVVPPPDAARGGAPVVVVAMRSLSSIEAQVNREMGEALRFALPVALVISLAAAWLIARFVAHPLERMTHDATRAADAGGENVSVRGSGARDELDVLAAALNDAFGRLRAGWERERRFASDAAHELRTPIAAVLGRADVALRRSRDESAYRAALEDIRDVAERATHTVERLLAFARAESRQPASREPVDLRAIAEREAAAARGRWPGARVRITSAGVDRGLLGDESLLVILVRNLIENAMTHGHSDDGVDIAVRATATETVLTVRDHGPGIPEADGERIFEPLFRLDASRNGARRGAGVGLALARRAAEAHDGTLTVVSRPGAGATFIARLPAHGSTAETEGSVRRPGAAT